MLKGHLVMAIACLAVLVSIASAIEVDETTGPFHISFDLPIDGAEVNVNDPTFGSSLNAYKVWASADDWYISVLIEDFNEPQELDWEMTRRYLEAGANGEDTKISDTVIDGKYALSGMRTGPGGTSFNAIFWLDESSGYGTKKANLLITSGTGIDFDSEQFQTVYNSIIDTIKISY